LKQIGHKKVILVGLSKGGVTVSNYVATYGTTNVNGVITISSPLDGTMVTDYFLPSEHIARIELGYKSEFTQELKKRLPKNIPFFHVVPTWDHVIIPCSSASIEGANHESKIHKNKYYSHLNIQNAPDVIGWIADWINKN
jgi:triacylglycerol esterase/lipase EstA (alpha/beta hydrolase family)